MDVSEFFVVNGEDMKMMTKNNITSVMGFLFMIAGLVAAFVVATNTVLLVITLVGCGLGLVFYKSTLYEYLISKIK